MKHLIGFCLLLLTTFGTVRAQDTLFFEDFEGTPGFTLNTPDVSGTPNGTNDWVINNAYSGGSGSLICMGFPFNFTVANTAAQPASISNPNGNYLHILSDDAAANNIFCSSYRPADGFCTFGESYFSAMTAGVSTVGYDTVRFSFHWLCGGSTASFGEVYYSTNSGTSWTLVTAPLSQYLNQSTWAFQVLEDTAFANQPSLQFGFRFVNNVATAGSDPGFGVDDVTLTGIGCAGSVLNQNASICQGDSIFLAGTFRNSPGTYTDSLTNSQGCDSFVVTTLAVNPNYLTQDTVSICQGDSVFLAGAFQTQAGTYRDTLATVQGCDSVRATLLRVDPAYFLLSTAQICQGDSFFVEGAYQTQSGLYFDSLTTAAGCDSVIQVQLNVAPTYAQVFSDTICDGDSIFWDGAFQTQTGTYVESLASSQGCDSLRTLNLSVTTLDTSVTENNGTLTANSPVGSYIWIDCNTTLPVSPMVNTQSFAPNMSGQYSVVVTQNGCQASSGCHTVVVVGLERADRVGLQVFPNPVADQLGVQWNSDLREGQLQIVDAQGRLVLERSFSGENEARLQVDRLAPGVYQLLLSGPEGQLATEKFVRF